MLTEIESKKARKIRGSYTNGCVRRPRPFSVGLESYKTIGRKGWGSGLAVTKDGAAFSG